MDQNERRIIEELFSKLHQAETHSGQRDPDAERLISEAVQLQPASPYYMSQVILVQEQAMQAQNERIQQLEKELAERPAAGSGGGFLGGLFGGGAAQGASVSQRPQAHAGNAGASSQSGAAAGRGWSQSGAAPAHNALAGNTGRGAAQPGQGGGFMASAMTTAVGVAGGMLMANALTGLFGGNEAMAAPPEASAEAFPPEVPGDTDASFMDEGGGEFDLFDDF